MPRKANKSPKRKTAPKRKPAPKPAKRVDWSKKKAPKPGTKARASYERSAIYKKRVRAAEKGLATRKKHEAREQRRLLKEERREQAKERLAPLLQDLIASWQRRRRWDDTKTPHANWYKTKLQVEEELDDEKEWLRMLEELSDEHDVDALGWDIIY